MSLCRLCLNKDELIFSFDDRLANGHQLRMCILLCTGVEIKEEDHVSKMVCHKCCSLAVKLYQYRQTALANDKALKEIANESFEEPPTNKEAILELHKSILENISQSKVSENVAQVYRLPLDDVSPVNNDDKVSKDDVIIDKDDESNNTHESVKEIFQYYPTAIVPREILDANVLPSVPVDRDIREYVKSEYEVIPADNSDGRVLKFKRKYPTADVVKLSVKRPRNDAYSNYFSDSDASVPPVFKSRKKDTSAASDGTYSDCDSDVPDEEEKLPPPSSTVSPVPSENRTNTRPTRSKVPKNPLQFPDSDSDSEVAKKPANTKYCEICDRTFWGWSQLKSHQRTHLKCIICRIICDSQEDLEYHTRNVCYKFIEYNQPILLLPKVDENPFLLRIYKDAFDRYYQDIDDGVYGPPEPPPPPDPDYPFYHDRERVQAETQFIKSVFDKFDHLDNTPVVRNKISQTRRAETHIKYYSRNQIVLEDMYEDLNMYKVPINVVVNPRVSAHLSFASQPITKESMDKWSEENVVDVVVPQKDPTFFLRPKKAPVVTKSVPPKTANRVLNKQEKHPKLLKALTSTTPPTTSSTTAPTVGEKTKSYNIAKLLSTTTTAQNAVPKTVSLVTTVNQIPQLRLPTRISSEVSLVPKQLSIPKSTPNANGPVYTNIMFRLPISTTTTPQQKQPILHQTSLPTYLPQRPPVQQSPHPPFSYIKEENDFTQQPHPQAEVTPTPPQILAPTAPTYLTMSYKLPTPPLHNQNDIYLKQEKDIEDNLYTQAQYSRPNMSYQTHMYRMPLSKPPSHMTYNQPSYPTQPPRYRPPAERKNNALLNNQQYYNTNHHQNGMRYRSVSGGSMMVLPNTSTTQEGGLLNQMRPPSSITPMPATQLLQTMNHTHHHAPINQLPTNLNHHPQQNHVVNSMYINSQNQSNIGKMSPISSIPSPLHSAPSPIDTKPLSSPINTMPPPLNNYNNNSYNATTPSLYDHSYADTFASNSYADSYPSTYAQPQPQQQYIPPYSPHSHMDIDPFVDQMLQQAAGSNKTALRVKQPWELNQV